MSAISLPYPTGSCNTQSESRGRALLDAALAYLARGWPVLPLRAKRPLIAWGEYQGRLPTEAEVRSWPWSRATGVAVVTGSVSALCVLDEDRPCSLEALGKLPATVESRTGRGGRHLFYRLPAGTVLPNRAGFVGGVDTRSEGGYIVVPPSLHPNGQPYTWVRSPEDVELASLPLEVLDRLRPPPVTRAARAEGKDGPSVAPEGAPSALPLDLFHRLPGDLQEVVLHGAGEPGQQSEKTWRVIMQLVARGWSDTEITALVLGFAIGRRYRKKSDPVGAMAGELRRARLKQAHVAPGTMKALPGAYGASGDRPHDPLLSESAFSDCGAGSHVFHDPVGQRLLAVCLLCGRCAACMARWRRERLAWLRQMVEGHDRLYLIEVAAPKAKAVQRDLQRRLRATDGDAEGPIHGYAGLDDGPRVRFLSTVPYSQRSTGATVTTLTPEEADAWLVQGIAGLTAKAQLGASTRWGTPRWRGAFQHVVTTAKSLTRVAAVLEDDLGMLVTSEPNLVVAELAAKVSEVDWDLLIDHLKTLLVGDRRRLAAAD